MTASCAHSLAPTARAVYDQQRDLLRLLDTGAVPLDVAKVFVCGDYGIGKTTLIETLTSQRHLKPDEQPPDEPDKPDERTAGIEVRHLTMGDDGSTAATPLASVSATSSQATAGPVASDSDSDDDSPTKRSKLSFSTFTCVRMAVFDFGGQPEFHVIHTLLVSDWTAAFVVCVDLSKSHEELRQSLWYWLRFIATRIKQSKETLFAAELEEHDVIDKRPRVILVGTKVDKCHKTHKLNTKDGSSQRLASCIHRVVSTFSPVLDVLTPECVISKLLQEPGRPLSCAQGDAVAALGRHQAAKARGAACCAARVCGTRQAEARRWKAGWAIGD